MSGAPIAARSLEVLRRLRARVGGRPRPRVRRRRRRTPTTPGSACRRARRSCRPTPGSSTAARCGPGGSTASWRAAVAPRTRLARWITGRSCTTSPTARRTGSTSCRTGPSGRSAHVGGARDRRPPRRTGRLPVDQVIADLAGEAAPGLAAMGSPRFFGFVIGGAHPAGVAADWLATDVGPGRRARRPDPERLADRGDRRPLARRPARHPVRPRRSRSSPAARWRTSRRLAAARNRVLADAGHDVERLGLIGAPRDPGARRGRAPRHRRPRAAAARLRHGGVELVDVDEHGAMRADALEAALATGEPGTPTIVVAQVGNVNTGAIDPMREVVRGRQGRGRLGPRRRRVRALGGGEPRRGAARSRAPRTPTRGRPTRTSGCRCPTTAAIAFVRDREAHRAAMAFTAAYLVQDAAGPREPMDWTPEFSRRARGLAVYAIAALARPRRRRPSSSTASARARTASPTGSRRRASRCCRTGSTRSSSPSRTTRTTDAALAAIQADGTCWPSATTWRGRRCIRISVCSHLTTFDDVDRSVDAMAALRGPMSGGPRHRRARRPGRRGDRRDRRRDARMPAVTRGWGPALDDDASRLALCVDAPDGSPTRANLVAGSPVAVTLSRPTSYLTVQLKGPLRTLTARRTRRRCGRAREHIEAFVAETSALGVPEAVIRATVGDGAGSRSRSTWRSATTRRPGPARDARCDRRRPALDPREPAGRHPLAVRDVLGGRHAERHLPARSSRTSTRSASRSRASSSASRRVEPRREPARAGDRRRSRLPASSTRWTCATCTPRPRARRSRRCGRTSTRSPRRPAWATCSGCAASTSTASSACARLGAGARRAGAARDLLEPRGARRAAARRRARPTRRSRASRSRRSTTSSGWPTRSSSPTTRRAAGSSRSRARATTRRRSAPRSRRATG